MLYEFLDTNREVLIDRCRSKVLLRGSPEISGLELERGIPDFLDQLVKTLQVEQTQEPLEGLKISGSPGGERPELSEMGETATLHGRELHGRGYSLEQVVHNYGDLCQTVTELAFETEAPIDVDEFRTLNRCLDNVIAAAVTEFAYQRDIVNAFNEAQTLNVKLGSLAHELRNHLHSMTLALSVIREGTVGLSGATGRVLDRSLKGMQKLIDHTLIESQTAARDSIQQGLFSLEDFIAELALSSALEARERKCTLRVSHVDPGLAVGGDRDLLLAAVGNLLQNAFKFTRIGSEVTLNTYAAAERIIIEVEDHCGGLPEGADERMFLPYVQIGRDRSGLGLGLSIAKRSVELHQGTLSVRNIPHDGCIFTISVPREFIRQIMETD